MADPGLTPTQVQQRLIRVVVQTPEGSKRELRELARQLGDVNKSVGSLRDASRLLMGVWGANLFGVAVSDIAQMADSMTLLNARATIFSKEGTNVAAVVDDIINSARDLRAPVNELADAFARIQLSTSALGVDVSSQIALTEVLGKSFKLSGATTAEATNSMIQLGQAFQRGSLRGQELNSVLTQNAILARALTADARKAGSDVRTLAEAGYFTNQKVFGILRDVAPEILTQFKKLPPTFADIFNRIRTEITVTAGTLNEKLGLSSGIYAGLEYMLVLIPQLSDQFVTLAGSVALVGAAFATWAAGGAIFAALKTYGALLAPFIANLGVLGSILAGLKALFMGLVGVLFSWVGLAVAAVAGIYYLSNSFIQAYGGIKNFDLVLSAARLTIDNFVNYSIKGFVVALKFLVDSLQMAASVLSGGLFDFTPQSKMFDQASEKLNAYSLSLSNNIDLNNRYKSVLRDQAAARTSIIPEKSELSEAEKMAQMIKNMRDELDKLAKAGGNSGAKLSITEQIGLLNAEFAKTGNFDRYNSRLKVLEQMQLNEKLKAGTLSLRKFHLEVERNKLSEWERKLETGRATLEQFAGAANAFKVKELKDKFDTAKISLSEFYDRLIQISDAGTITFDDDLLKQLKEMNVSVDIFAQGWEKAGAKMKMGIGVGLRNYTDNIKGLAEQTASATNNIAGSLEDTLVDAFAKGKDSFADFSNFVVSELMRIVIRLSILKPLLQSITTMMESNGLVSIGGSIAGAYFGGGGTGGGSGGYGLEGSLNPGIDPSFSSMKAGSLQSYSNDYSSKTYAAGSNYYSQSGVNITVNNNTDSGVSVSESMGADGTRNIELIIDSKVNQGIAQGKYDNAMRTSYGVQRRGQ